MKGRGPNNDIIVINSIKQKGGAAMITPPDIANSTIEERRAFIKAKFPCIADCDMCGLCKVFRGQDAEHAYGDYISGKRSYMDVRLKAEALRRYNDNSDVRRVSCYDNNFSSSCLLLYC